MCSVHTQPIIYHLPVCAYLCRPLSQVLQRYPQSVKLLRSYARFQEEVLNNSYRARRLHE